jgi:hypothetical protein
MQILTVFCFKFEYETALEGVEAIKKFFFLLLASTRRGRSAWDEGGEARSVEGKTTKKRGVERAYERIEVERSGPSEENHFLLKGFM